MLKNDKKDNVGVTILLKRISEKNVQLRKL